MIRTLPITEWNSLRRQQGTWLLVDVRTPREYQKKRLPDSVNLPLDQLEELADTMIPSKDTTLYVYCRSGNRSAMACRILDKMGYRDLIDLGGIIDWPYETVKG